MQESQDYTRLLNVHILKSYMYNVITNSKKSEGNKGMEQILQENDSKNHLIRKKFICKYTYHLNLFCEADLFEGIDHAVLRDSEFTIRDTIWLSQPESSVHASAQAYNARSYKGFLDGAKVTMAISLQVLKVPKEIKLWV